MAAQLEQLGFSVREDVLDGLFPLTSEYDVVAIDVTTPSGRDLVHAVRERYPTTRLLGIANSVIMSSQEAQMDTRTALTRVGPRRLSWMAR